MAEKNNKKVVAETKPEVTTTSEEQITMSATEFQDIVNRIHRLENKGQLQIERSTLKPVVTIKTFQGLPIVNISPMTANVSRRNDRGLRVTDQRLIIGVLQESDDVEEVELVYEDFILLPAVRAEVVSRAGETLTVRLDSGREFAVDTSCVNA